MGHHDKYGSHSRDLDAHTRNMYSVMKTGVYISTVIGTASTGGLTANKGYATPLQVARKMTLDRLAITVTVAGAAGTKARLGIYADNGNAYPGALILDAGEVAVDSTGLKAATISQQLDKGLYWLFVVSDGTPTIRSIRAQWSPMGLWDGDYATYLTNYFNIDHAYGALIDPCPAGAGGGTTARTVFFRIASLD